MNISTIPRLFITRGISGSGKSTWAFAMSSKYDNLTLVSLDDIRLMCWKTFDHSNSDDQQYAVDIQYAVVEKALRSGKDVIVHNTSIYPDFVGQFRKKFQRFSEIYIVDFSDVDLDICIERDAKREIFAAHRFVGLGIISSQSKRLKKSLQSTAWKKFNILTPMEADEILSAPQKLREIPTYIPDTSLPDTVIIDIDGTLANIEHRSPFDFSNYHLDALNHSIAKIPRSFSKTIILTGRDERYRDITEKWLSDHNVYYELLFMRPDNDKRPDYIVKQEIFFRDIAPFYNVEIVFEDRKQVVEMWREIGLVCAHVDEGDF